MLGSIYGEAKDVNTKARQSILALANSIEAIIGAIYLDKDYDTLETFIHKNMIAKLPQKQKVGQTHNNEVCSL